MSRECGEEVKTGQCYGADTEDYIPNKHVAFEDSRLTGDKHRVQIVYFRGSAVSDSMLRYGSCQGPRGAVESAKCASEREDAVKNADHIPSATPSVKCRVLEYVEYAYLFHAISPLNLAQPHLRGFDPKLRRSPRSCGKMLIAQINAQPLPNRLCRNRWVSTGSAMVMEMRRERWGVCKKRGVGWWGICAVLNSCKASTACGAPNGAKEKSHWIERKGSRNGDVEEWYMCARFQVQVRRCYLPEGQLQNWGSP
ncbi:hypothetical protein BDV95DRAFT_588989 [Massariosphaeria phaeospora]|uniref:Uncharacterized protein n=1 Tax=Massariosphaeria phaeospora TaxID=100035 RepID=A0A7C8MIZ1_9PLEO|nr:hypothetical protein BDV95DRAFT_588989 [Massariosphaeria phaeospora]